MINAFRARPLAQQILFALTGAAVAALLVAEGLDTGFAPTAVAQVVSGALCVVALCVPPARLLTYGAVAVAASCAVSVVTTHLAHRPEHTPGATELAALLLLTARGFRLHSLPRGIVLAGGAAVAAGLVPLRLPHAEYEKLAMFWPPVFLLAVALTAVLGLYLRVTDIVRARDREAVRQAQRLEHARELHDFVAHHVTAIVAQTKAVRFTTAHGQGPAPEELDRMLGGIEEAGAQALDSMRGMVTVLRGSGASAGADGDGDPTGFAALRGLTEDFARSGPPATLALDPRLAGRALPPELTTTVHRVVREALTNVRKHATDARRVTVDVRVRAEAPDRLAVSVTDDGDDSGDGGDGGSGAGARSGVGSGFGLIGLRERVEAVGGRLDAGPQPGGGWEVAAELPLPARA
ncbi:sensor histidine kinase [Streptomyces sp. NPDC054796]